MKSIFTGQRFHRQNCYRRKIFKTYTYSNRIIPQLPIKKRTFTCLLELFIFLFASKLDQRTAEYIPFHRANVTEISFCTQWFYRKNCVQKCPMFCRVHTFLIEFWFTRVRACAGDLLPNNLDNRQIENIFNVSWMKITPRSIIVKGNINCKRIITEKWIASKRKKPPDKHQKNLWNIERIQKGYGRQYLQHIGII